MSPAKINLNDHTQARAYNQGKQDAFDMLVKTLEETGDVNFLLDVLEDNAAPDTAERLRAFYRKRNKR